MPWLPGAARLEAVGGETGLAVDDVGALTDRGGLIVIQAKGRLDLRQQESSAFAEAVRQVVRQFIDGVPDHDRVRPVDEELDRLVIAGDDTSSGPIRELAIVTARLRTLPASMPLLSTATNEIQRRGLTALLSHMVNAWRSATSNDPTDKDVRAVLRVLAVDVLDLGERGADRATALAHLRSALLDPSHDGNAWIGLTHMGHALAQQRAWRRRPDIGAELDAVGAPIGPARRFAADVRTLRRLSEANLAALSEHSGLSVAGGVVSVERAALGDVLNAEGDYVLVGDPGCGKSGILAEVARRLATSEDVLVLGVDNLPGSAMAARAELGLSEDLTETLREWSGAGRATLVLDGLDAARGEGVHWLARLCESLTETRWRIIASIRHFDLRHALSWQKIFKGEPLSPRTGNEASDLPTVRHHLLGNLSDDDLAQLAASSPAVALLLDGASSGLRDLVKNPFNLNLAVELLDSGATVASLAHTRDQLQLLQRYWRLRVADAPGGWRRVRALSALTNEMLTTRRLRADASVVSDTQLDAVHGLLQDGVLREASTTLLAHGTPILVFAHHILFDFAVAGLVFTTGGQSALAARLRADPTLSVIARPSMDLHLADLWHADTARSQFVTLIRDIVTDGHAVAGIAGARTAIEGARTHEDFRWLVEEFRTNPEIAATITGWLCGVMDAADDRQLPRLRDTLTFWPQVAVAATEAIEREFNAQTGQVLYRLLFQLNKIDPLTPDAVGARDRASSAARLMAVCLAARDQRSWLAGSVGQLLPRAVAVDPAHGRTMLDAINADSFAAFGSEVIRHFIQDIEYIADGDPDTATAIMTTLWTLDVEHDEPTHLLRGVLSLTSTQSQDLDHVKWLSGEKFSQYVAKAGRLRSLRVVASVVTSASSRYPSLERDEIEAFGSLGYLLRFADDLDHGPGYGTASKIVDSFIDALRVGSPRELEAIAVIKEAVALISHPEFWRRLLVAACDLDEWWLPIASTLATGALIKNTETRAAAGRLIGVLTRILSPADHARLVEKPIRRAASLYPPESSEWRDRAVDQMLGCLDVDHVQDPELKSRLSTLLEAGSPPGIPGPMRVVGYTEPVELRDVLGSEAHDTLGNSLKGALEALYAALRDDDQGGDEPGNDAVGEALRRLMAIQDADFEEPAHEIVTRAADRLASEQTIQPGTALGDMVAQVLLRASADQETQ